VRTVWKYTLSPDVPLPIHGKPIHVGVDPTGDPSLPTVWVELDPDGADLPTVLTFIGTGHPVPAGYHVGSVVTPVGLVWHVYASR
jgi:hypothetical protein